LKPRSSSIAECHEKEKKLKRIFRKQKSVKNWGVGQTE
jgi:hypothetical protein